jgi:hypothetical protein
MSVEIGVHAPGRAADGQWAELATNAEVLDIESVSEMLKTTNYGKCVYEADNDVVDHQVVNIEYEGGTTASLTMSACGSSIESTIQLLTDSHGEPMRSGYQDPRYQGRDHRRHAHFRNYLRRPNDAQS